MIKNEEGYLEESVEESESVISPEKVDNGSREEIKFETASEHRTDNPFPGSSVED